MKIAAARFRIFISIDFYGVYIHIHMITEERKVEVPARETLRMWDTFGYILLHPSPLKFS